MQNITIEGKQNKTQKRPQFQDPTNDETKQNPLLQPNCNTTPTN